MKTTKIILLLVLIGMTTSTYAQEMDANQQQTSKYTAKRSPVLSTTLSLLTFGFGGGQYYNKQYLKAGIMTGINTGVIIWLATLEHDGTFLDGLEETLVGMLILGANWVYSIIDAPISSSSINKKYGLDTKVSFSPSIEKNKWDVGAYNVGLKVTLSLD